ncbi:MAG TPA: EAL domain-containing protein [Acidimicrobiales bacterium]|nr:EAL domain-containing protein [Acidimicrobiales bacterium]
MREQPGSPTAPGAVTADDEARRLDQATADNLQQLAERYFWLFEDSPVAKYVCDTDGLVMEVNSALCQLLGVPPEQLVGRTLASFALDPPVPEGALAAFLDGRTRTYSNVRRYRRADGHALRALVTLGAIRDSNGRARTIFGEVEDLTAQDMATSELDRQRGRLELAIEASGISVWELDVPSGRVTLQERPTGAAGFREQSMTYGDFVRGFDAGDRARLPTIKALRSRACVDLDLELRTSPLRGPVRWVHLRGRATLGEEGSVVRVAGTTADVTEPRAQRAELAAQRDRLELALETASMMAWELVLGPEPFFRAVRPDILGLCLPERVPVAGDGASGVAACPVFGERVLPADREVVNLAVRDNLSSPDGAIDLEYRWRDDGDANRWLHTRARAEADPTGQVVRVTGTTADLTAARREVSARLRAERILSRTLEASQDAFIGLDDQGRVTDWNPAAEVLFGWFRDEMMGSRLVERICPDPGSLLELLTPAVLPLATTSAGTEGQRAHRELEGVTRDGRRFPAEVAVVQVEDDDGVPFFRLFVRDLSERKAYESQLVRNALFDPLTGLPNRALLLDRLNGALRRLSRVAGLVAVLFIDVDRFKRINDSISHRAGDEFLVQLGQRIRSVLRPADTVARFGADEFVVLCEALESEREAMALAARVEGLFSTPFVLGGAGGREIYVSAAVGIALSREASTSSEALVRDAGTAMHRAKEHGGGHAEVFDAEIRRRSIAHFETESALRRALERGELSLYYQPVVDLTGRLDKVEALVRWPHPGGRVGLPAEFVPLAEETGLIVPLGETVLQMACRQLSAWRRDYPELSNLGVSVNVSSTQLRTRDAVERMAAIIAAANLPPGALILEITESVLMDERTDAGSKLATLRALGVSLAVDDFGTGYSSLLYLRRFPLDMLKIDRSFVAGLVDNPEDATIVDAVVRLGHSFGLQTVAEGVETAEQLRLLRSLGCDLGQGHFWGRPLPPEDLLSLLLEPDAVGGQAQLGA